MSTTRTNTRRRRMALAAATMMAAFQVAAVGPAIAHAEQKTFLQSYYQECANTAFSSLKADLYNWDQYLEALSNCCTNLGGIYNERTQDCYLPDGTTIQHTQPPTVPPGTRANLPPGADKRAGIQ
jgi:hypothetical protein